MKSKTDSKCINSPRKSIYVMYINVCVCGSVWYLCVCMITCVRKDGQDVYVLVSVCACMSVCAILHTPECIIIDSCDLCLSYVDHSRTIALFWFQQSLKISSNLFRYPLSILALLSCSYSHCLFALQKTCTFVYDAVKLIWKLHIWHNLWLEYISSLENSLLDRVSAHNS